MQSPLDKTLTDKHRCPLGEDREQSSLKAPREAALLQLFGVIERLLS